MSHIVQFSYRFNEDIKRIYECFSDFNRVSEMSFAHVMTNMKKINENNINEEGAMFNFMAIT